MGDGSFEPSSMMLSNVKKGPVDVTLGDQRQVSWLFDANETGKPTFRIHSSFFRYVEMTKVVENTMGRITDCSNTYHDPTEKPTSKAMITEKLKSISFILGSLM